MKHGAAARALIALALALPAAGLAQDSREEGLEQEDFQAARIEGNRLVLRGGDEPAPAEEAPADTGAAAEGEANAGAEVEANAGAEQEANQGAEQEANAAAEAEAADVAAAEAAAEEAAEREADARLLLPIPDVSAPVGEQDADEPFRFTPSLQQPQPPPEAEEPVDEEEELDRLPVAEVPEGLIDEEVEAAGVEDEAADLGLVPSPGEPDEPVPLAGADEGERVDYPAAAEAAAELDADAAARAAAAAAAASGEADAAAAAGAAGDEAAGAAVPGAVGEGAEGGAAPLPAVPFGSGAGAPPLTPEEQQQLEVLERNAMIDAVNRLNLNQQWLADQADALQEEQEAVRERGEDLEGSRLARIQAYEEVITALEDVQAFLAVGGGTGAATELASLSATLAELAAASVEAAGEAEGAHALRAQEEVDLARVQLEAADLYNTRLHLGVALRSIRLALEVAETAAEPLYRDEGPQPLPSPEQQEAPMGLPLY